MQRIGLSHPTEHPEEGEHVERATVGQR
eukprot:COSAG02_NODE_59780_length_273_cov_0.597701_1_plen_27_part_10